MKSIKFITLLSLIFYPYLVFGQNQELPIIVQLNREQIKTNSVRLVNNGNSWKGSYIIVNDETYYIDQVRWVSGKDANGESRYFLPASIGFGKVFVERIYVSPKIEVYATRFGSGFGYGFYREIKKESLKYTKLNNYFAFSKDKGIPQKMNYNNLKASLEDNAESMREIKKGRGIFYLQMGLYAAGAAILVGGINKTFKEQEAQGTSLNLPDENSGPSVPPFFFVAAATLYIPYFINPIKYKHFGNALESYK